MFEIIKLFYKNNRVRNVGIPTNGFFTEKIVRIIQDILETCPDLDLGVDVFGAGLGLTVYRVSHKLLRKSSLTIDET